MLGEDRALKMLALPAGSLEATLAERLPSVTALAIGGDGSWVAVGLAEGAVRVWAASRATPALNLTPKAGSVLSVAFNADATQLACGGNDGSIKLYELPSGKPLVRLKGHEAGVRALAWSADGQLLVSAGNDKTVRVWRLPQGDETRCLADLAVVEKGTDARRVRESGLRTETVPCGTPTPPGATCICDCVATSRSYHGTTTVCTCNTIMVPAGSSLARGSVCTCDTVAVGTRTVVVPSGHERQRSGTVCTCDTICTCNTVRTSGGGHYWYPN